jgi:hypothetical protein
LKTPHRDVTTHVIFEPLNFMARLAALVLRPRVNLAHYHGGVLAEQPAPGLGDEGGSGPCDTC